MPADRPEGARRCPTCGQTLPQQAQLIRTAADLIAAMRAPGKNHMPRDVYEIDKKFQRPGKARFCLTYGGGYVAENAIRDAIRQGLIVDKYPEIPGCYWQLAGSARS